MSTMRNFHAGVILFPGAGVNKTERTPVTKVQLPILSYYDNKIKDPYPLDKGQAIGYKRQSQIFCCFQSSLPEPRHPWDGGLVQFGNRSRTPPRDWLATKDTKGTKIHPSWCSSCPLWLAQLPAVGQVSNLSPKLTGFQPVLLRASPPSLPPLPISQTGPETATRSRIRKHRVSPESYRQMHLGWY